MRILAGDIGGTSTRLAIFDHAGKSFNPAAEQSYPSREHSDLKEIVNKFFTAHSRPVDCACFGIAGPVKHGRVEATNLPWIVDAEELAGEMGLSAVGLINDLEANAWGVAALEEKDFIVLNEGAPDAVGNAAIISAGTGLGEAGLYWDGKQHHPFACEGGHADFAPSSELEAELLRYLWTRFEHVSYERVLSGPGLHNIYQFLRDTGRGEEPAWLRDKMRGSDPSVAISEAALKGTSELCVKALDLFVSVHGAEAGNLALKVMATSGVFVGGGIAPKILPKLKDRTFMDAFTAKGRFKTFLEAIPVRVILNEKTPLLGAARYAAMRC